MKIEKHNQSRKTIGLVLSGGGAQGAYQAGVIKALFQAGLRFKYISGVSIGALNGLLTARGMIRELEHTWMTISRMQLISINSIPGLLFSRNISLLGDQVQRDLIEKYIDLKHLRTDAIELLTAAVSLQTGEISYFSTKKVKNDKLLKSMLLASCAIPGIFPPVEINNEQFIDGGLLNNTPIGPLLTKKLTDIITISMEPKGYGKDPLSHIGDVALRSTSIFFRAQAYRAEREWRERKARHQEYTRLRSDLEQLLSREHGAALNKKFHAKVLARLDATLGKQCPPTPQLHLIRPENNLIIQQYDFDAKKIPYTFELGYLDGLKFLQRKGSALAIPSPRQTTKSIKKQNIEKRKPGKSK